MGRELSLYVYVSVTTHMTGSIIMGSLVICCHVDTIQHVVLNKTSLCDTHRYYLRVSEEFSLADPIVTNPI